MAVPTLATLMGQATKQAIYDAALTLATTLGLPVTSWSAGDPTRSLYWVEAEELAANEAIAIGYVSSGFLDLAAADSTRYNWLVLNADQYYGYTAEVATYAGTPVTLTNTGGGLFADIAAGDITTASEHLADLVQALEGFREHLIAEGVLNA